jgi:S1-C subfamily serine protease
VARDAESDLAIFAAPADLVHLPGVPLLDGEVPTGQPVYLSGFPHGYYHLTEGQVTGFKPRGQAMLHTASSLGGTSGGMLITPSGELCGIHVGGTRPGSKDYPHKLAIPSPLIAELLRKSD